MGPGDSDAGRPRQLGGGRVLLRPWRDGDLAPFAELNADPEVASWLNGPLTRAQSDEFAERILAHFEEHGFGFWALEVPGVVPFAGFVGMSVTHFEAEFTPCVEIGWRLAHAYWGRGYVTEAGRLCLDFGFGEGGLTEIVSFTAVGNRRSRAVMERLGLHRSQEFDHPRLPPDHPLLRHVLYRLEASAYPGDVS